MNSSLLIECIFVYLALLPNISAIFSLAFFGNMYEEHLLVRGHFDKQVCSKCCSCHTATLDYIKIEQEIQTDLLTMQAWWYTILQALCWFFSTEVVWVWNRCESSFSSHLEVIWIFPLLSKEISERATDCCNGAFQPCLRISSSCKAFQLILQLTRRELFEMEDDRVGS